MKLGILKATEKASNEAPAPKMAAVTISRMKPKTREIMVMPMTTVVDLTRLLLMRPDLTYLKKGLIGLYFAIVNRQLIAPK